MSRNAPAEAAYAILRRSGETAMDRANIAALRRLAAADGYRIVQSRLGRTNQARVWLVFADNPTTVARPDSEPRT